MCFTKKASSLFFLCSPAIFFSLQQACQVRVFNYVCLSVVKEKIGKHPV